jgi:hypothetical protein
MDNSLDLKRKCLARITRIAGLDLKRKCLARITRIAARGASSLDPDDINATLQDLAYLLNQWLDRDLDHIVP